MSILLVTALLGILAAQLIGFSSNALSNTRRASDVQQTYWYARAGESFAISVLAEDARLQGKQTVDSLHDTWAQNFAPFKPDEAELDISIVDLNACFNVNNLMSDGDNSSYAVLAALFHELELPEASVAAVSAQLSLAPLHSTLQLSELLELSAEQTRDLAELICVLPSVQSAININTAPRRLLSVVLGGADLAEEIISLRKNQAIESIEAVGISNNQASSTRLGVSSDYFSVRSTAHYAGRHHTLQTRLFRDQLGILSVLDRQQGTSSIARHNFSSMARSDFR